MKLDLLSIAQKCALDSTESFDYLPKDIGEAQDFQPHAWVMQALYSVDRHYQTEIVQLKEQLILSKVNCLLDEVQAQGINHLTQDLLDIKRLLL